MPEYRRAFVPGGTFFITIVTFDRHPLFSDRTNILMLRAAVRRVKRERPFATNAYVILPDHLHFVWTLPVGDSDFSRRIGRMKALFTKMRPAGQNGGQCPPYNTGGPCLPYNTGGPCLPYNTGGPCPPYNTGGPCPPYVDAINRSELSSREKHREANVWQRRFWEHTIRNERDFQRCIDYIHYNPVKHGATPCPHDWQQSSFHAWARSGVYANDWSCACDGRVPKLLEFADLAGLTGE